jgi:alkylation response protein AidB-like acyl-CoA dehydrogenase
MCKLWGTEAAWTTVNDTMQIRGGRGYVTAASLAARGETPAPVERFLRDSRINTIFEGSSEIMRLFIAREMLDAHLKVSAAVLDSRLSWPQRLRAAAKAARFYVVWYPKQFLPLAEFRVSRFKLQPDGNGKPVFGKNLVYVARTSRRLARALFYALLRNGPRLERQQLLLGRFADIGAELFAITAMCSRAEQMLPACADPATREPLLALVNYFCGTARGRIEQKFHEIHQNGDAEGHRLAQRILAGKLAGLTAGIVQPNPDLPD